MPRQAEDLTKREFGKWTVLEKAPSAARGLTRWKCVCKCGRVGIVGGSRLRKGHSTQCKTCAGKQQRMGIGANARRWSGHGEIHLRVWSAIKKGAAVRGIEFDLTIEFAWDLFLTQGRKCAASGIPLHFPIKLKDRKLANASLDRIDSSRGYVPGNVQWVHKTVNLMKQQLTQAEFVSWCRLIVEHQLAA